MTDLQSLVCHSWAGGGSQAPGIFLTDVLPRENAATASRARIASVPYDPRWNCLFMNDGWHGREPNLHEVVRQDQPPNTDEDTLLHATSRPLVCSTV